MWIAAVAVMAVVGLFVSSPALGAAADRQQVAAGFTALSPATPTGDFFRLTVQDPSDPSAKPPRVTRVVEIAPAGSTSDPSALPRCTATDQELMVEGAAACPPGSLDATGRADFVSGFGAPLDPIAFDLQAFYNGHGLSTLASPRGTPARFVTHTEFTGPNGNTAVTDFPDMPGGPPDGHTALKQTTLYAPPHGNFFGTPPSCPTSGYWTFRVLVTYADGVTQESDPRSPCRAN